MKNTDGLKIGALVIVAMLVAATGIFFAMGGGKASTTDKIVDDKTGAAIGPWSNKLVSYKLITSDKFTGADVAASAKVYSKQPEEWLNARGDFDKAAEYTQYNGNGTVTINKEVPGKYFVVLKATGYNTEFLTIVIPDGQGRGDISDYQGNPDSIAAQMSLVGATVGDNVALTLTNATAEDISKTALEPVTANTQFRGWKVIVTDANGFSTDTDGDGKYDEGISKYTVTVGTKSVKVFDPANGVDLFDSNDEYAFLMNDVVSDKDDLTVKVEIRADTASYSGANDEKLGEGDGLVSNIKIYDAAGSLFTTVTVTA